MKKLNALILLFSLVLFSLSHGQEKSLVIYHDADYSNHVEASDAIFIGFSTALSEVNNSINGYKIVLEKKDHRGNSKRSLKNMRDFLQDPDALLILGGLHSPPYIEHRTYINENNILLLVPWAAGAPITRYEAGKNWVFRLSVDDSKAGYRLANFALNEKNCKSPHLLLEQTGWGKGNLKTISQQIYKIQNRKPDHTWFTWGTGYHQAKDILKRIYSNGSDCIVFVGNAIEGKEFATAMADLPKDERLPMISHWGITGGNFHEKVPNQIREKIDLNFIQSCFTLLPKPKDKFSEAVFEKAKKRFPDLIKSTKDIKAPPGFAHGYDIGRLMIEALKKIGFDADISILRSRLRDQLENLSEPIRGLVKTYQQPFSSWSESNRDAHEALGLEDICMGYYHSDDSIYLYENQ